MSDTPLQPRPLKSGWDGNRMKDCTCNWKGHPTWMHDTECAHRKEREAVPMERTIMLRVAPNHQMTVQDAERVAARLVEFVNSDDAVDQTFYVIQEGDATDLGM